MSINNFQQRFLIQGFFPLITFFYFLICHDFILTPHYNFIKMLLFIILLSIPYKSLFTNYKLFPNFIQFIKLMSKFRYPLSFSPFIKFLIYYLILGLYHQNFIYLSSFKNFYSLIIEAPKLRWTKNIQVAYIFNSNLL